jgi:hypothetical protein
MRVSGKQGRRRIVSMRCRAGTAIAAMCAVALALVAADGLLGIGSVALADAAYCLDLKRVTDLAATKDKFSSIAGQPRDGNFRDTSLPLTGWRDCSLYGPRSYTCDSRPLQTSEEAEKALATIMGDIGGCLGPGWIEDKSRSSSVYVVLQNAQSVASITLSTDLTEKQEHVVRLILFLRGR